MTIYLGHNYIVMGKIFMAHIVHGLYSCGLRKLADRRHNYIDHDYIGHNYKVMGPNSNGIYSYGLRELADRRQLPRCGCRHDRRDRGANGRLPVPCLLIYLWPT